TRAGRFHLSLLLAAVVSAIGCHGRRAPDWPRPTALTAPPVQERIDQAIARGQAFLVADQNTNGSWGSATRTKGLNIMASIPGSHHAFRTGTTALCISALIETRPQDPQVIAALVRAEAWLIDFLPRLRRGSLRTVYNTWGHIYGLEALVRMHERHRDNPDLRSRIAERIRQQIHRLGQNEFLGGGWGYYDFRSGTAHPARMATSFTTAAGLVALREAADAGFEIPPKLLERALGQLRRQRSPNFTYLYSEGHRLYPVSRINRHAGSLGRSCAGNAAGRLWEDEAITDEALEMCLDRLFARGGWLDVGRKKPVPHESFFAIAGYFYYFGHYYGARCIELVPPERQPFYQDHLADVLLPLQEADGSWWDYPLYDYHQPYGTAFALRCLQRTRKPGQAQVASGREAVGRPIQ
ncbi:MAG: hypothetical protein OER86_01715, partial [Phycisphaerae bacterium]|nr:hypothetical protein [Phycisphaerae bacterium]